MYLSKTHWFYFIIAEIIPICGSVYYTATTKWIFFNSFYLKIVTTITHTLADMFLIMFEHICVRRQDPEGLRFFLPWIIACSEVNSGILWHFKDSAVSSIIGIEAEGQEADPKVYSTGSKLTDWLTDWLKTPNKG